MNRKLGKQRRPTNATHKLHPAHSSRQHQKGVPKPPAPSFERGPPQYSSTSPPIPTSSIGRRQNPACKTSNRTTNNGCHHMVSVSTARLTSHRINRWQQGKQPPQMTSATIPAGLLETRPNLNLPSLPQTERLANTAVQPVPLTHYIRHIRRASTENGSQTTSTIV